MCSSCACACACVCVRVCVCVCVCVCVWVPEFLFVMWTCLPGAGRWPTGIGMDVIANMCSAVVAMNVTWGSPIANSTILCTLLGGSCVTVS